jgi:hypothetical protein
MLLRTAPKSVGARLSTSSHARSLLNELGNTTQVYKSLELFAMPNCCLVVFVVRLEVKVVEL